MSTKMMWQTVSTSSDDTEKLGQMLGQRLQSSLVVELRADLGGGKTTFARGLARGLGSKDIVSSPTFTLSKIYKAKNFEIHHFDFYRLSEPGVLAEQLEESLTADNTITLVEWSDIVKDVLPDLRLSVEFSPTATDPDERQITLTYPNELSGLIKELEIAVKEVRP